MLDLVNWDRI